jgi:hypothetical protein
VPVGCHRSGASPGRATARPGPPVRSSTVPAPELGPTPVSWRRRPPPTRPRPVPRLRQTAARSTGPRPPRLPIRPVILWRSPSPVILPSPPILPVGGVLGLLGSPGVSAPPLSRPSRQLRRHRRLPPPVNRRTHPACYCRGRSRDRVTRRRRRAPRPIEGGPHRPVIPPTDRLSHLTSNSLSKLFMRHAPERAQRARPRVRTRSRPVAPPGCHRARSTVAFCTP